MLKKYFTTFLLFLFFTIAALAQNVGDYGSVANGNWNNPNTWGRWNGTAFVYDGTYPGQNPGTYDVYVQTGNTVVFNTNGAIVLSFDQLYVDGNLNVNANTELRANEIILRNGALLAWTSNNTDLKIPGSSTISLLGGSLAEDSPCSATKTLTIGSTVFASCNNGGNGVDNDFGDINNAGGTDCITGDSTAPVPDLVMLPDAMGECSVTVTAPTATDACAGTITASTADPLTYNVQGTYTITWIYDDGNGNTSTQTQNVIVEDVTAPVPDVASLANATGQCSVTISSAPTATDNCGGTITGTTTDPLTYNTQGTYNITWTYDDGNGNMNTQTQTVIVDDITAPVADLATLAEITAQCEVTSLSAPTATDNCGGVVTVTNDAVLPITTQGTTVVTWTYTDMNGNSSTQTQNVVIDDVTAPTASNLSPVTVYCAFDVPAPDPALITDAADNCGIPSVIWSRDESDGMSNPETRTRYYTVTDAAGNSIEVTQVITVYEFVITSQPADIDAFAGDTVSINVVAENVDTYQWQLSSDGGLTWTNIDGLANPSALTDTLIIDDVLVGQHGYMFRAELSNSASTCSSLISDSAILSVGVSTVITNRTKTFRVNKN